MVVVVVVVVVVVFGCAAKTNNKSVGMSKVPTSDASIAAFPLVPTRADSP